MYVAKGGERVGRVAMRGLRYVGQAMNVSVSLSSLYLSGLRTRGGGWTYPFSKSPKDTIDTSFNPIPVLHSFIEIRSRSSRFL
jgi:hypothetical protein